MYAKPASQWPCAKRESVLLAKYRLLQLKSCGQAGLICIFCIEAGQIRISLSVFLADMCERFQKQAFLSLDGTSVRAGRPQQPSSPGDRDAERRRTVA